MMSAQAESGSTMAEFAQCHGLRPKCLQRWRERLTLLDSSSEAVICYRSIWVNALMAHG